MTQTHRIILILAGLANMAFADSLPWAIHRAEAAAVAQAAARPDVVELRQSLKTASPERAAIISAQLQAIHAAALAQARLRARQEWEATLARQAEAEADYQRELERDRLIVDRLSR